jgi:ornithine carbamoyltransferase
MSKAFETWLEIVVISIVNANPFIKNTQRRKEREEKYLKLINLWKDKNIPAQMLADLVNLMQEHHKEKLDIL